MAKHQKSRIIKSKKQKNKKRIMLVLIPLFLIVLGVGAYGTYLYMKADKVLSSSYVADDRDTSPLRKDEINPDIDNFSVLIMGVDDSEGRSKRYDSSRTDALMVATFNKEEHSIKLLTIPRDSLVYIPHVGYEDKINHAHAFGGSEATIDTVENLLDIPIDYYVKMNFHAFVDVVDALGGIEVDVPYDVQELDSADNQKSIQLYEGVQKLDGEEALALARTRRMDSDIERGKRQQEIMKEIINKATSASSVLRYDNLLKAVGDNMTTNMAFSDMRTLISYGASGAHVAVETNSLTGYDYQPQNVYYFKLDEENLEEKKTILQAHLDLKPVIAKEEKTPSVSGTQTYGEQWRDKNQDY